MIFTSWPFLVFLPTVLALYFLLWKRARIWLLFAASYFFYGWWDWRFLSLIVFSTLIDYVAGGRIEDAYTAGNVRTAKRWVAVSMIGNLGLLGFFKYAGFFAEIIAPLTRTFGIDPTGPAAQVILPIGISFYTFQTMSYTIDVYRKDSPAERDLLVFATYVMYFPQLVAGPIERPGRLMPQLKNAPRFPSLEQVRDGVALIILGFFKKVAMADVVGMETQRIIIANALETPNGEPIPTDPATALCCMYLLTAQVYFDFSGYTDIARGCSKLMGIELMQNFDAPFLSTSVSEFWRRWHISLGSWFRDYLYSPLRRKRGEWRIHFALIATTTASGFWHGADWKFVLWGLGYGLVVSWERFWHRKVKARLGIKDTPVFNFFSWFVFFHYVVLTIPLLFCPSTSEALKLPGDLFRGTLSFSPQNWETTRLTLYAMAVMFFLQFEQRRTGRDAPFLSYTPVLSGLVTGIMLLLTIYWSEKPSAPFIYFQF
jgi:D-alanyl-lipoteichoic acid acyltransferase DltB (MBOAT superfamily)